MSGSSSKTLRLVVVIKKSQIRKNIFNKFITFGINFWVVVDNVVNNFFDLYFILIWFLSNKVS